MMTRRLAVAAVALLGIVAVTLAVQHRPARAEQPGRQPVNPTFSTVFPSPSGVEGLTADHQGNLYTAGRPSDGPCPVYRIPAAGGAAVEVGFLPAPCAPSGLAFDRAGRLYVADGDQVRVLSPDAAQPPLATTFVSGVPGANGVAFGPDGQLWVSDGGTGQGRVWRVPASGGIPTLAFRVQPMANEVNLVDGVGGVGRDARSLPTGTITVAPGSRNAANTAGSQAIVANGLAFTPDGRTLFVADTARGAIWRVDIGDGGAVRSPRGCDTTFTADTLCLDDILVQHPYLEGADGIALDHAGTIWVAANERNALVTVSVTGRVHEFFRDPPDPATRLRNTGPLEFPTSPYLAGNKLCVTQSNNNRRDNAPSSAGEAGSGSVVAKISCLDQPLAVAGLPLPI